jgi:hypothetical protein
MKPLHSVSHANNFVLQVSVELLKVFAGQCDLTAFEGTHQTVSKNDPMSSMFFQNYWDFDAIDKNTGLQSLMF